ncbi:hypothetical protein V8E54_011225 [Elaphomyces granulatus]
MASRPMAPPRSCSYFTNPCLSDDDPLRRIPAEVVRDQVSLTRGQQPINIGKSQYPKPYYNDQDFFPPSNSYLELPLDDPNKYLVAITYIYPQNLKPGPARVIYDNTTGEIMGVIAHASMHDRTFMLATRREYRPDGIGIGV